MIVDPNTTTWNWEKPKNSLVCVFFKFVVCCWLFFFLFFFSMMGVSVIILSCFMGLDLRFITGTHLFYAPTHARCFIWHRYPLHTTNDVPFVSFRYLHPRHSLHTYHIAHGATDTSRNWLWRRCRVPIRSQMTSIRNRDGRVWTTARPWGWLRRCFSQRAIRPLGAVKGKYVH